MAHRPGLVWALVWRLRRQGAATRGVPTPGPEEAPEPPLGGWAPILDDQGNAYGEPAPVIPTDAPHPPSP